MSICLNSRNNSGSENIAMEAHKEIATSGENGHHQDPGVVSDPEIGGADEDGEDSGGDEIEQERPDLRADEGNG